MPAKKRARNRPNLPQDPPAIHASLRHALGERSHQGGVCNLELATATYLNNNLPSSGIALEGYLPVAFIAVNKPVMGKPEHASMHKGVTYHFVNADAKAAFDADPERYVPAYGGWCAFSMAIQDMFPVDPTKLKIVDGRLNLFLRNKGVDALDLWNHGDERELTGRPQQVGATRPAWAPPWRPRSLFGTSLCAQRRKASANDQVCMKTA